MSVRTRTTGPDGKAAAVWVDLGRQGGEPCIYGTRLPTHIIAGLAWENGIDAARSWYPHISEAQAIGACWFEVAHGNRRKWRKTFPDWPRHWNEDEWRARPQNASSPRPA